MCGVMCGAGEVSPTVFLWGFGGGGTQASRLPLGFDAFRGSGGAVGLQGFFPSVRLSVRHSLVCPLFARRLLDQISHAEAFAHFPSAGLFGVVMGCCVEVWEFGGCYGVLWGQLWGPVGRSGGLGAVMGPCVELWGSLGRLWVPVWRSGGFSHSTSSPLAVFVLRPNEARP